MLRFANFANRLIDAYPGSETILLGAENIHSNEAALDRIVIVPNSGQALPPSVSAQGWQLADIDPTYLEGVDDIVITRRLTVDLYVWASDFVTAENRLHALLIALLDIGEGAGLGSITERWPQQGDITSGGAMVILSVVATIFVTAADRDVVLTSAAIGAGGPQTPVEGIEIAASQDDELIATDVIPEGT